MVPLSVSGATFKTAARLSAHDAVARWLARADRITLAHQPVNGAVLIQVGEAKVSLDLAGIVDLDAERARLRKEIDRLDKEIERVDAKLNNEQFLTKAKEEVVEEQRERRSEFGDLKGKTEAALSRLG